MGTLGVRTGRPVVTSGSCTWLTGQSAVVLVPGGEERCATGVYDLPCAPMGVPRVWAIERDHKLPLGKWGTHRDGLAVVFCRRR